MTPLEHVRFTLTLTLNTDAHIGTGESRPFVDLRPDAFRRNDPEAADREAAEVATVVRDHAGAPTIPATALKGALRKVLEAQGVGEDVDRLFGALGAEDSDAEADEPEPDAASGKTGAMGCVTFYAAEWTGCDGRHEDLPVWCDDRKTWIATHVAIARDTGAADPKKLFFEERVPAGTRFKVDGVWFGSEEDARTGLQTLLAPLASADGVPLGAGNRLGGGTARLGDKKAVGLTVTRFNPKTGAVDTKTPKPLTIQAPALAARVATLTLTCEGPFLSVDPQPRREGENRKNRIQALRRDAHTPVLHMESVAGALRQRAAWLATVHGLVEGDEPDDRFRKPSTWKTPDDLTVVERLFGVTGWRGLLRVIPPAAIAGTPARELVSIALDRFTGAVLDGTVFTHEVFTDVSLSLGLAWDARQTADGESPVTENDESFLKLLLDDLDGDILPLGHATNRGFGWFGVSVTRSGGTAR